MTPLTFDPASASFGFWNGNMNVSDSLEIWVKNVSNDTQSCSVAVTGPAIVSASPSAFSLGSGETTSLTLLLEAGRRDQTGSGDYTGDVEVTCDSTLLRVPWWVRIERQGAP
jgi:hypothetical protein